MSIAVDHPTRAEYLNLTLVWKDGRLTRHLVPAEATDLPISSTNNSHAAAATASASAPSPPRRR